MSINFPRVVCINLDRRPERWRRVQNELARHGITQIQRFSACDGQLIEKPSHWLHSAGAYGCLRSHLQVVADARAAGSPNVLIFEDDAVLAPNFRNTFSAIIKEVPDDWDILYLGALHKDEPVKVSTQVARVTKANSTYAYALKNTVFDAFIELNSRAEHVLDMNSYLLQERFNCYCFVPNLAWVQADYSDVQNRLERHWYLEQSLVLFGAQIDRLLSRTSIIIAHENAPEAPHIAFLKRYYEEYFSPYAEVTVEESFDTAFARSARLRDFVVLLPGDLYLEALDFRANLRMCESYDATTGFDHVIELTPAEADLLHTTGFSRGIDVTQRTISKNKQLHFCKRSALESGGWRQLEMLPSDRIFQAPNHAFRLPAA